MNRPCTVGLAVLVVIAATRPALADDPAAAEKLFNDGLADMQAGQFESACPKIAESFRLESRAGTLFTLAECWRKAGKTATALARYDEYLREFSRMSAAEQEKQRGRDQFARRYAAELRQEVPKLTLNLAPGAPADTVVERDGVELGRPSLGQPLPVDPGTHVIVARTPDGLKVERQVTLEPRDEKTVTLSLAGASTEPAVNDSPGVPPPGPPPSQPDRVSTDSSQRTIGYVVTGVGAVGLVVGAVTGAMVLGKKGDIDDNCGVGGDPLACNADGKSAADSAQTLALVSTIAFGVGIVGVGAGTTLILTAPRETGGFSAAISGRF